METSIQSLWLLACLVEILVIICLAIREGKTWHVFFCGLFLLIAGTVGFFECLSEEVPSPECAVIAIGLLVFSLMAIVYCFAIDFVKRGRDGDRD
jgi:uncharacterized membrane protein YecN with MAPEG domain